MGNILSNESFFCSDSDVLNVGQIMTRSESCENLKKANTTELVLSSWLGKLNDPKHWLTIMDTKFDYISLLATEQKQSIWIAISNYVSSSMIAGLIPQSPIEY